MVALEIRFPAGRFHATPWGRHVNEGITEWPISPWRFLRALVAVAYRTDAPRSADTLKSLVENLASALPSFQLPQANSGHTRHYMPLYRSTIDGKTTKVFDTFVALEKDVSLKMVWPEVNLTADQQKLLTSLLSSITYLGRAESWVEIVQAEDWDGIFNAYPLAVDGQPSEEEELVRLACPSPGGFQELLEQSKNDHDAGNRKNNVLPESFFSALCAESGDLQKAGWSQPPGLKWVDYVRPRNCFSADYQHVRSASAIFPTVARFAVSSRVPPLFTNAITVGEKLREALLRWSDSEEVFLWYMGTYIKI